MLHQQNAGCASRAPTALFPAFLFHISIFGNTSGIRLSPTHALISINFDAGSSNLLPEWRETAGNPDFCYLLCEITPPKIAK